MEVYVYYNLHKHLWSIREWGRKVFKHTDIVVLTEVQFKVSEAGRQRVLREKRKNVHAGVKGNLGQQFKEHALDAYRLGYMTEITYNPYKYDSFVIKATGEPVKTAEKVLMIDKKVYAMGVK